MPLEWVRLRALQNEARICDLVSSGNRAGWMEFTVASPAIMTLWCSLAPAHPSEPVMCVYDSVQEPDAKATPQAPSLGTRHAARVNELRDKTIVYNGGLPEPA